MKKLCIYFYCLTLTASLVCMQKKASDSVKTEQEQFELIKRKFQHINTRPIQPKSVNQQNQELLTLQQELKTLTVYPSQEERAQWEKNIAESILTNQIYQQHLEQRDGRTILNILTYQKALHEAGLLQSIDEKP